MDYDEIVDDFEDIDLLELIMSDSNSTNQYLIFEGSNTEFYAINVSKVMEILVYKDLEMVKNGHGDSIIRATAKIRDQIATIINFDEWFGNEILEDKEYEFIVLSSFGGYNLGIMIKSVEHIVSINPTEMMNNSQNNAKTNFIANIKLSGVSKLCTIFDCDRLLADTFKDDDIAHVEEIIFDTKISSDKWILFADDSALIQKMVRSLFEKLGVKFKIFTNGQELLDELISLSPEEVGLIITDIEMPIMDGINLIKNIRSLEQYDDISIIVHTNMSNFIVEDSLVELEVDTVISKINIHKLSISIMKYFKA